MKDDAFKLVASHSTTQHWGDWLAPILMGSLLRLVWLQYHFHELVSDEIAYHEVAIRMAQGQPYEAPFWPPGWPLVLAVLYALFGDEPQLGLWLNTLLSVLVIVLTGGIAVRLFNRATAVVSMWFVALMPSFILPVVLLRYEVLLQFLCALGLCASLWIISRWHWVTLTIFITALAVLIRPLYLLLPCIFWLCNRFFAPIRLRPLHLLVAQIGVVVVIAPWVWYASSTVGYFVPVALNGGVNLWIGNNPDATGLYMSPPAAFWDPLNEAQARTEAIHYILQNPGLTALGLVKKLWYSLAWEPWTEWVFLKTTITLPAEAQWMMQLVADLYYWPIFLLAIASTIWLANTRQSYLLLPILLLAYSIGGQLPFWGSPRFRWIAQFLLAIYAAAWVASLISAWRTKQVFRIVQNGALVDSR